MWKFLECGVFGAFLLIGGVGSLMYIGWLLMRFFEKHPIKFPAWLHPWLLKICDFINNVFAVVVVLTGIGIFAVVCYLLGCSILHPQHEIQQEINHRSENK